MPRKKTTVLDEIEVPGNQSELQKAILTKLDGLPPILYGIAAETPYQRAAWVANKQYFKRVGAIIDNYFNGDAPPDFSKMPKAQKEDLWNTAWRYLAFSGMVYANWETVKAALKGKITPPMPIAAGNGCFGQPITTEFELLQTPLEVTLEAMQYRAIAQMVDTFAIEVSYVPGQERKRIEKARKARRADATKAVKNQFQEDVTDWLLEHPWAYLESFCAQAVVDAKPKGVAKKALNGFLEACRSAEDLTMKVNHRRNVAGKPRYTFREGMLISKCT